jgi:hypothetical protein
MTNIIIIEVTFCDRCSSQLGEKRRTRPAYQMFAYSSGAGTVIQSVQYTCRYQDPEALHILHTVWLLCWALDHHRCRCARAEKAQLLGRATMTNAEVFRRVSLVLFFACSIGWTTRSMHPILHPVLVSRATVAIAGTRIFRMILFCMSACPLCVERAEMRYCICSVEIEQDVAPMTERQHWLPAFSLGTDHQ